jgi:flagellar protein FliO/FliZ
LIKIVATQPLGQRERVVLIEIGDQWLLLGVAPGTVNALQTLPKGTLPAAPASSPFARLLAATRGGPPQ